VGGKTAIVGIDEMKPDYRLAMVSNSKAPFAKFSTTIDWGSGPLAFVYRSGEVCAAC
jgi:hypothetical protein